MELEGRVNAPTVEAVEDKDALIRAVQIWDTAILRVEGSDGLESAKLLTPLLKLAEAQRQLGNFIEATPKFTRLMMLGNVHSNLSAVGEGFLGMALCAEAMREWEAVEQAGRQLISVVDGIIAEASGQSNETLDEWNVACLNSVGTACRELYRPHEAAAMHLRALKLARAMGLGARAAQATRGLGRAMLIIDGEKYEDMAQVLTDSVRLHEFAAGKLSPPHASTMVDLAELWLSVDKPEETWAAEKLLREAIPSLDAAPPSFDRARATRLLGDFLLMASDRGEPANVEAKTLYATTAETLRAIATDARRGPTVAREARETEAKVLIPLAIAHERLGEFDEAVRVQTTVVGMFAEMAGADDDSTQSMRVQLDRYRAQATGGLLLDTVASTGPMGAPSLGDALAPQPADGAPAAAKKKRRKRNRKSKRKDKGGVENEAAAPAHNAAGRAPSEMASAALDTVHVEESVDADIAAVGMAAKRPVAAVADKTAKGGRSPEVDRAAVEVDTPPIAQAAGKTAKAKRSPKVGSSAVEGDTSPAAAAAGKKAKAKRAPKVERPSVEVDAPPGAEAMGENASASAMQQVDPVQQTVPRPPPVDHAPEPEVWVDDACQDDSGAEVNNGFDSFADVNHYAGPPTDVAQEDPLPSRRLSEFSAANHYTASPVDATADTADPASLALSGSQNYAAPPADDVEEVASPQGPLSPFSAANHYGVAPHDSGDEADESTPNRRLSGFTAANHYDPPPRDDIDDDGVTIPERRPSSFSAANHYDAPPQDGGDENNRAAQSPADGGCSPVDIVFHANDAGSGATSAAPKSRARTASEPRAADTDSGTLPLPTIEDQHSRGQTGGHAIHMRAADVQERDSRDAEMVATWTLAHYAAVGGVLALVGGLAYSRMRKT